MTTRPRRHHERKPGPASLPRRTSDPAPPGDDHRHPNRQARTRRAAGWPIPLMRAARLAGLSRDLLYDEMRRGNLASIKIGRRRVITRQHLRHFRGIAS